MSILICKNAINEGPGTIEDFLKDKGIAYYIAELSQREEILRADDFDALILMGGPMSVNDYNVYPYLAIEEELVKEFLVQDKKILGICLGAQIMAKALGAEVYRGRTGEIGWHAIELTGEGLRDNLMGRLALHPSVKDFWRRFTVFHWHEETFDIPEGAVRLASSELYPNQAFKYGDKAYAFQFHIEVNKAIIDEWFSAAGGSKNESMDIHRLKKETEKLYKEYYGRAKQFYDSFFNGHKA
ncbi:MAG: type 1 glutamine amidotransferase [Nitrospirota bacterium]